MRLRQGKTFQRAAQILPGLVAVLLALISFQHIFNPTDLIGVNRLTREGAFGMANFRAVVLAGVLFAVSEFAGQAFRKSERRRAGA